MLEPTTKSHPPYARIFPAMLPGLNRVVRYASADSRPTAPPCDKQPAPHPPHSSPPGLIPDYPPLLYCPDRAATLPQKRQSPNQSDSADIARAPNGSAPPHFPDPPLATAPDIAPHRHSPRAKHNPAPPPSNHPPSDFATWPPQYK